ncbi:ATP-dependent Clp protease ATP-binding subunit ClpE [Trichinella pseudospiralis]
MTLRGAYYRGCPICCLRNISACASETIRWLIGTILVIKHRSQPEIIYLLIFEFLAEVLKMSAEDSNKEEDKPANSNSAIDEIEMRIKGNMTDPATFPESWNQLNSAPLYIQELYKDEDISIDNEEDFEEILDDEWETECGDNEKNEQLDLEELWDGLWEARLEEDDFHASLKSVIVTVCIF